MTENRRQTVTTGAELITRARAAITAMAEADGNEGTSLMEAIDAGQECADVLAQLLTTAGHPYPETAPRKLTVQERIEARHWLQVLSEHALTVRNALDPGTGMLTITDTVWASQWAALRAELDAFTGRVRRGERAATASPGAFQDRNG
jgi:hypothetical protein